eukprot:2371694-Rhodomonas_salina.4
MRQTPYVLRASYQVCTAMPLCSRSGTDGEYVLVLMESLVLPGHDIAVPQWNDFHLRESGPLTMLFRVSAYYF